jgi:general secretion pathway protein B
MSLILDALKRSEHQRRLARDPVYRKTMSAALSARLWPRLMTGMAVLLIAALAALGWSLLHPPVAAVNSPPEAVESSTQMSAAVVVPGASENPPPATAGEVSPHATPVALSADKPASIQTEPATGHGDAPWLASLPDAFRRRLPPLVVNIHVYSPDEGQRILYINNRPVRRGEALQDGIVVEEVVEDGAVLKFREQRFKLPRPR